MPRFVVSNPFENKEKPALIKDVVNHPLISGYSPGGIIRDFLQSQNYIQGSQGWRLRPDGIIEALGIQISGASTIAGWNVDATKIHTSNAHIHSGGYISFGSTPPSFYGNNIGVWLGFSGGLARVSLYSNSNNYLQWDGAKLLIRAANFTLDSSGNITATNVNLTGAINATSGSFTGAINATSGSITGSFNISGLLTVTNTIQSSASGTRYMLEAGGDPRLRLFSSSVERMRLNSTSISFWNNAGSSAGSIVGSSREIFGIQQPVLSMATTALEISGSIFCTGINSNSPNGNSLVGGIYTNFLSLDDNGGAAGIYIEDKYFLTSFQKGLSISSDESFLYLNFDGPGGAHVFQYDNITRSYIDTAGNYVIPSDIRLKKDIAYLNKKDSLNTILKLKPAKYKLKNGEEEVAYGLIAQDVEEIKEETIISRMKGTDYMSIKYTQIIPLLIGAIHQLNQELQDLKNMV